MAAVSGCLARRRKWQFWVGVLATPLTALVWPIALSLFIFITGQIHLAKHPDDDAPGMLLASFIGVGIPILVVVGILLAIIGFAFGYSWRRCNESK